MRSVDEAKFFLREALDALSPSLNLSRSSASDGQIFNSYFGLLRCVLRHSRMAYLVSDDSQARISLLEKDRQADYDRAVKESIELQYKTTNFMIDVMDEWMEGRHPRWFLTTYHREFMKDLGKRNMVISRVN